MPASQVIEGAGAGQYNLTIDHVTNGDPGNQDTFRAPSINLENRTDALKEFVNTQADIHYAQLGESETVVGGIQGDYNNNHRHSGADSILLDHQEVYNNGNADADVQLESGGSFQFRDSTGTVLLNMDNDTKKISFGDQADDIVDDNALNYGTGTNQINLDAIPAGSVCSRFLTTKETSYDGHLAANASTVHSLKLIGRLNRRNNFAGAAGASIDVSTEMSGETGGGSSSVAGVVTDGPYNTVAIRTADSLNEILDSGNRIYGRITKAGAVWTLTFYKNVSGTETSHTLSSTDIVYWVTKTWTLSNMPFYDEAMTLLGI